MQDPNALGTRSAGPPGNPLVAVRLDLTVPVIVFAVALACWTILTTERLFDSPNDSSRWNTIYALMEHGTYAFVRDPEPPWASRPTEDGPAGSAGVLWTIDMIRIDGRYYSSKPPLLPTCLAGIGLVASKLTGWTFHENPRAIERIILITAQVLPFALFLWLLRGRVFRMTSSVFVRNFTMACAALCTFLTPWVVTLNNHVLAACTGFFAVEAAMRIWYERRREWHLFALAGFLASFTAAIELPAGLLAVALFIGLLARDPRRTLLAGLTAAAVPACAALYTNYLVTGSFSPAYARFGVRGGPYDYPGSYWNNPQGIDALAEPRPVYLVHMLIGHEGFFSLTPIFLISAVGLAVHLRGRPGTCPALAGLTVGLFAAVVGVYTFTTNNYGGGCNGFRWLFWMIPLWLIFLPAGIERLGRSRGGQIAAHMMLAVSLYSAYFAMRDANPWTHSWLRILFRQWGWIDY